MAPKIIDTALGEAIQTFESKTIYTFYRVVGRTRLDDALKEARAAHMEICQVVVGLRPGPEDDVYCVTVRREAGGVPTVRPT